MDDDEDLALFDRWCAGDKEAGDRLLGRHFESVYRFLITKVDGNVDDLVQETFLACVTSRDRFRRQSTFLTYLFAIAHHVVCAYWRRRAVGRDHIDFDEVPVASLSTSLGTRLARRQDRAALLGAMRRLPLAQQSLLDLAYWQELDRDQLAIVFDVEPVTISVRLFRARAALRATLADASVAPGDDVDFEAWVRSLERDDGDAPTGDRRV